VEPEVDNERLIALTDAALERWRQGDCVIGEAWFVHRFDHKQTDEGRALRALREIRVSAGPSWDAETVSLMFWFIRDENDRDFAGENWSRSSTIG